ncbi:MAG: hypothetical protein ABFC24_08275 [Methanoregulaceae archaeon]
MIENQIRKPRGRKLKVGKKPFLSLLGVALLLICISVSVVQAADPGTSASAGGNENTEIPFIAGLTQNGNLFGEGSCGEHWVYCWDKNNNFLGTVEAPCYWKGTCDPDNDKDYMRCKGMYGENVVRSSWASYCQWE